MLNFNEGWYVIGYSQFSWDKQNCIQKIGKSIKKKKRKKEYV